ncbi:E3 ubiquitin-protein ligase TRIM45-like [Antedon mediterranea]|uniref:E3 ubiquitin-protein ligase TRIM45-like n=1 Tax=Antedon mediterranea TaxID=105859 RepID=UPI003AF9BFAF
MASEQLDTFLEDDIEHTSSPIIDEKVLECAICEGRLNNPKYLSCHHTFCLKCLDDWVKRNGELLSCPTCSKSCSIPEEGLQGLPPNTSLANLLETIEQFTNADQMKCVCGKEGNSENYCQNCRQFLCLHCSGHHKNIRTFENHKLQSVEDVRSMSVKDIIATYPPLCSIHNEPLSSFCKICNIPICIHCSITNHKQWEGKDKHMLHVGLSSDELKTLKETSVELEKAANQCTSKLNEDLKVILDIDKKLEENKERSLQDIDNHVEKMVARIKESGETLKREVRTIYNKKKTITDFQITELTTAISDINTDMCLLHHLGKSGDGATTISSGNRISRSLDNRIKEAPKTIPDDDLDINFVKNKKQNASLQEDIGMVIQTSEAAVSLELDVPACVTTDQVIDVKITKIAECDLDVNDLEATWKQPSGEINIDQIEEDNGDYYIVRRKCKIAGVCQIDVSVDGKHIKKSPMTVKVEEVGLMQTVRIPADSNGDFKPVDVVEDGDDCLLVSYKSNAINRYKQSGEYVNKITLPSDVKVNRMFKMKNGNVAFSDYGKTKSIKICTMDGEVVKSVGESKLNNPEGIHVNEVRNTVHVCNFYSVIKFNIESGQTIKEVYNGKWAYDVVLTRQNILVSSQNDCIKQITRGSKVIIDEGDDDGQVMCPRGIKVDDDDNIIVASNHKLQLFSNSGEFIKRIDDEDNEEDELDNPTGLSIISYYPRRVAVVSGHTVKIFNY